MTVSKFGIKKSWIVRFGKEKHAFLYFIAILQQICDKFSSLVWMTRASESDSMTRTLLHLTFQIGGRGAFHNSIIGNLIINQDRIDRNLLQLLAHPENSEWCSTISVSIFVVNIVSVQKQTYSNDFFIFCKFPFPSTLLL